MVKNNKSTVTSTMATPTPTPKSGQPQLSEAGKIIIALGKNYDTNEIKDKLDIIMLKNPVLKKKYHGNRSAYLIDVIKEKIEQNKQYL